MEAQENKSAREIILDEVRKTIVTEKVDEYGRPEDNFQTIANYWNNYLSGSKNRFNITAKDVAIMMILLKIARTQNGNKHDTYVDMVGYAAIAFEMMDKEETVKIAENLNSFF